MLGTRESEAEGSAWHEGIRGRKECWGVAGRWSTGANPTKSPGTTQTTPGIEFFITVKVFTWCGVTAKIECVLVNVGEKCVCVCVYECV